MRYVHIGSYGETFYNMMGACVTILKQQKVVAGFEQSICCAAELQAVALPPQPFLFHDPALQMQWVSDGAREPAM